MKVISIALLSILYFLPATAQRKDTTFYYLKNSGRLVPTKDSADFFLVILPPDTNIDKDIYRVNEFYSDGKIRIIGGSKTNNMNLKFDGPLITFFRNGRKKMIQNFENGTEAGDVIEYYPNGRFYNKKSYVKTVTDEVELQFKDCSDSTGKIMAANGNGYWVSYNSNFTLETEEGKIVNGQRDSTWKFNPNTPQSYTLVFKDGKPLVEGDQIFSAVEYEPQFPGGMDAFLIFLEKNIRYPAIARENNTKGTVIVSFVIERDGTLSNVKLQRGIGDGCDEEAIRVIKLSPPWKPGIQSGKLVRVAFSIPISFSLSTR